MKQLFHESCPLCTSVQDTTKTYQEFISRLSHEIRNPLTLINSSLQLLEKDCPQVTNSFLWPQILEDIRSIQLLLKDVSSLNGQRSLHLTPLNAHRFLSSISSSFSALAKDRAIFFSTNFAPDLQELSLKADELKLREAITNLLVNAADAVSASDIIPSADSVYTPDTTPSADSVYTPDITPSADSVYTPDTTPSADSVHTPDTTANTVTAFDSSLRRPQITLSAGVSGSALEIRVRDNGPGIPKDYLPTLFDPFVTHKSSGTGLGLNIVKNIAALHHGTITVDTCCYEDSAQKTPVNFIRPKPSYTEFCLSIPTDTDLLHTT